MRVFFSDTLLFEALMLPCLSQERPSFSLIEKVLSGTESISAAYLGDAVIFRNWWQSTHSHGGRLAEDKAVRSRLKSRKKKFCLGAERRIWIPKKRAHTTEATRGCRIKPLDSSDDFGPGGVVLLEKKKCCPFVSGLPIKASWPGVMCMIGRSCQRGPPLAPPAVNLRF